MKLAPLALCLIMTACAHTSDRAGWGDAATTYTGLHVVDGIREANPILAPIVENQSTFFILPIATQAMRNQARKKGGEGCRVFIAGTTGMSGTAAISNALLIAGVTVSWPVALGLAGTWSKNAYDNSARRECHRPCRISDLPDGVQSAQCIGGVIRVGQT